MSREADNMATSPSRDHVEDDPMYRYHMRDRSVRHIIKTLIPNPGLDGTAADISAATWQFAQEMAEMLQDGPELTSGLRKLRESKDCLVVQALQDSGVI